MGKLAFLPFSIGSGMLAGLIGKKIFGLIWKQIDDQKAPQSEHRNVRLAKLALALAIEGALLSLVKGFVDHGSRHAFARLTGTWPGEETPETE
jgi:hypothetical protein